MLSDKHVNRIIITKSAADIVADIPKTYSECAINVPRAFSLKKFSVKKDIREIGGDDFLKDIVRRELQIKSNICNYWLK